MADSLGTVVNAGLKVIGESEVESFTDTNILQGQLIEDANETAHDLLAAARYQWGLHRDAFTTEAKITTGTVGVTNGSSTVTSKDASGNNADNFGSVESGNYIKVANDQTTYEVASVDTGSSPDTLTLSDSYLGTTDTDASYVIFRDTYALSIANMDEVVSASCQESNRVGGKDNLEIVTMVALMNLSNGDLHRNTSGKPGYLAQRNPDASDNPQFVLWPYPDTAYLVYLLYTPKFTSNTTFGTNMFGGDAPDLAYDALRHHSRWRACVYDDDLRQAQVWLQQYERARLQLAERENRAYFGENVLGVKTYRPFTWRRGTPVVSQIQFDTQ
jgi:hypothetical protein